MTDYPAFLNNKNGKRSNQKLSLAVTILLAVLGIIANFLVPLVFPTHSSQINQIQSGANNIQQGTNNSVIINNTIINNFINQQACTNNESVAAEQACASTDYYQAYLKSLKAIKANNYSTAIEEGIYAIILNRSFAPSYEPVASAFYQIGDTQESEHYASIGLLMNPNSIELNLVYGYDLFTDGNYIAAYPYVRYSYWNFENNSLNLSMPASLPENMATLSMQNNDSATAITAYKETINKYYNNSEIYDTLGYLYLNQGDCKTGVSYYLSALNFINQADPFSNSVICNAAIASCNCYNHVIKSDFKNYNYSCVLPKTCIVTN